ncbi:MAG: G-D-S-L family lipolytic protein [Pseudomonadota bacterium]
MNTINRKTLLTIGCAVALSGSLTACDPEFVNAVGNTQYSAGNVDFSRFVAVGDSLTAGFADGTLYIHGQQNSFPAILAEQFAMVGGGAFTQPLMNDNNGGLLLSGTQIPGFGTRLVLAGSPLAPVAVSDAPTTDVSNIMPGPYNNMGVPGAKSFHLGFDNYGAIGGLLTVPATANPFYVRMAASQTAPNNNIVTDALMLGPSFFTLWIGNNDTLSYATGGGTGVDQLGNPNPATYGSSDLTDPTAFAGTYSGLVTALTSGGAKGVLINLPDVTSIPYFTTVPFNAIPMDQATADATNAGFATYNATIAGLLTPAEAAQRTINFTAGQNAVVILDETLTDLTGVNPALLSMRHATAEDFILLPSSSKIGTEATPGNPLTTWGVSMPLEDGDVLTAAEATLVANANAAFNATIAAVADANPDLILFDAAAEMAQLASEGINYGTGTITTTFATGGAFSLDGVHPTARGYAVIANLIMDVIEAEFGAVLPPVDPSSFTTTFIQ